MDFKMAIRVNQTESTTNAHTANTHTANTHTTSMTGINPIDSRRGEEDYCWYGKLVREYVCYT